MVASLHEQKIAWKTKCPGKTWWNHVQTRFNKTLVTQVVMLISWRDKERRVKVSGNEGRNACSTYSSIENTGNVWFWLMNCSHVCSCLELPSTSTKACKGFGRCFWMECWASLLVSHKNVVNVEWQRWWVNWVPLH